MANGKKGIGGLVDALTLQQGVPNFAFGWAGVIVFAFVALQLAYMAGFTSSAPLAMIGAGEGAGAISTATVGGTTVLTTQQVTTVDIASEVRESIADGTGVKNRRGGSLAWYYDGQTSAYETTTLSTSAYVSSTNDAVPNSKIVGVYTNASYYTTLIGSGVDASGSPIPLNVPYSPAMQVTGYADALNTIDIQCYNTTSGNPQATGMNQSLGADESKTLNCKLIGGTARGIFRGPIVIGLDFQTSNFSTTDTYIVGGTSASGYTYTNVLAGYEVVQKTALPNVVDFAEVPFQVRLGTATGANPDSEVTIKVVDCGATYSKAVYPLVYTDCENKDTGAAIGSTDDTFVIYVD